MLVAEIVIKDEAGKVVVPAQQFDARKPFQWKAPPDRPVTEIETREGDNTVVWNFWCFTYQPVVVRELRRRQS